MLRVMWKQSHNSGDRTLSRYIIYTLAVDEAVLYKRTFTNKIVLKFILITRPSCCNRLVATAATPVLYHAHDVSLRPKSHRPCRPTEAPPVYNVYHNNIICVIIVYCSEGTHYYHKIIWDVYCVYRTDPYYFVKHTML